MQLKEVFLLDKLLRLQKMAELMEIIKQYSKIQNEISQTIEEYNKESPSTESKIGQNALIQSKVF